MTFSASAALLGLVSWVFQAVPSTLTRCISHRCAPYAAEPPTILGGDVAHLPARIAGA